MRPLIPCEFCGLAGNHAEDCLTLKKFDSNEFSHGSLAWLTLDQLERIEAKLELILTRLNKVAPPPADDW